jgi:uncharacterized protein (DUF58 family)
VSRRWFRNAFEGFVLPTSRGWLLLLNSVVWYVISRVNHNVIALSLAWVSVSCLVVSWVSAFLSLRGLRFSRVESVRAQAGRMLDLPLRCVNGSVRPRQPFIVYERFGFTREKRLGVVVPSLAVGEDRVISRLVLPFQRGMYRLSRIQVRGGDVAGLFYRQKTIQLPQWLVVYPSTERLGDLGLGFGEMNLAPMSGRPVNAAGFSQDFYGVREYHPSDGMRFIHWRSTARRGKPMVREFERNAQLTIGIFLDGQCVSESDVGSSLAFESAIILVASLVERLRLVHCNLVVGFGGAKPVFLDARPVLERYEETLLSLATMAPGELGFGALVDEMVTALPTGSVVYCVTLSDKAGVRDVVGELSSRGYDVRWFVARSKDFASGKSKSHNVFHSSDDAVAPRYLSPSTSLSRVVCGEDVSSDEEVAG